MGDDRVRVAVVLAAVTALSAAALAYAVPEPADTSPIVRKFPPAPPLLLRKLPPQQASSINRQIPFSPEPNPAARPFHHKGEKESYGRALECLTTAIYYEGATEPAEGQLAIAQVILNRVRHPAFPRSVCDVVYEGSTRRSGCQFSFTCDGSLRRTPDAALWRRSRTAAEAALAGGASEPVGYATHYHADYVVPYWAMSLAKNAVVGRHIFYRFPGAWGRRAAFKRTYTAREAEPGWLRAMALAGAQGGALNSASPPGFTLEVDPRVELISIVHHLAANRPPGQHETPYVRDVRAHFSRHSNHLAVLIYRQLSGGKRRLSVGTAAEILMHYSPPPQLAMRQKVPRQLSAAANGSTTLAGFISALGDFSKQTAFEKFFRDRKAFYAKLVSEHQKPATEYATRLENLSAIRAGDAIFVLAPLMQHIPVTGCQPLASAGRSHHGRFVIAPTSASVVPGSGSAFSPNQVNPARPVKAVPARRKTNESLPAKILSERLIVVCASGRS